MFYNIIHLNKITEVTFKFVLHPCSIGDNIDDINLLTIYTALFEERSLDVAPQKFINSCVYIGPGTNPNNYYLIIEWMF